MPLPRPLSTLLWLPVNLAQGLFTAAWTALLIPIALAGVAVAGPRFAWSMARRLWAPGLLAGAGARLVVTGREQLGVTRARLVVANHQSWIDVPALVRALPVPLHFLAKRELAAVPLLGWYIRAMGMVFVERGARRRAAGSVAQAGALLAAGRTVVSFPEGTRSRDGRLRPFKSGAFGAALATGTPVLPVALVGPGAVLPAGGFRVRPGTIEVRIGAPIDPAPFAPDDRAGLARATETAIRRLLDGAAAADA
jgi:1-acyl-sn-glycerol-3-phosphate acyltransferase